MTFKAAKNQLADKHHDNIHYNNIHYGRTVAHNKTSKRHGTI